MHYCVHLLIKLSMQVLLLVIDIKKLIALMTDFGYKDPYVGVMKGVIKSINPNAEIVDLTHGITRHSVLEAAVNLLVSAEYFPQGTIFVVVVDPGVGSERRALLIETNNYILIGPDNGCLSLLIERDGVKRAFDISNSRYRLLKISSTFHGRDVFAPIAAWVSRGISLEDIGVEIDVDSIVKVSIEKPMYDLEEGIVIGRVLYIDLYGNVMTNVKADYINLIETKVGSRLNVIVGNSEHQCIYERSFSRVPCGELACYINSWGFLEVAVNMGDASQFLKVKLGDKISFKAT